MGRGLVGAAADGRRPDRPDRGRGPRLDGDAPERRDRRGSGSVLLRAGTGAEPRRLRARQLPVGALPLPGAARPRGRRLRGRRRDRGRDRRAHVARPDQPRALQVGRDPGRREDRPPRSRGRCPRHPRRLPIGRHRSARRDRARRRLRGRRLGQMALRRPRKRLALRPPRPRRAARARLHRLAGARDAVRVRGGDALRGRRGSLPHRHAERPGALRRYGRLRPDRGDRGGADPRQLAAADRPADPPRRAGGVRHREPARAGETGRHRHRPRRRVPGRPQGARGAPDPLRLPPRRGDQDRPALLQRRR